MTPESAAMQPGTKCQVIVPGSTANIGPGFDSLGCAISIHNEFEFEVLAPGASDEVVLEGSCQAGIPATADNLALTTAKNFIRAQGIEPPPLRLRARIEVPNARGLGSSSTAIVAGLVGANSLLGNPLDEGAILDLAVSIEGHPDNVAPTLLGGLVVSAAFSVPLAWTRVPVHPDLRFVFVIPDYEVRTAQARSVLPATIPREDAIFNLSRTPLVVLALQSGDADLLAAVLDDRLHQPQRKPLFRRYDDFAAAAKAAGAAGFCVSGAGPTMLAICESSKVDTVRESLEEFLTSCDFGGRIAELAPDNEGTVVHGTVPAR